MNPALLPFRAFYPNTDTLEEATLYAFDEFVAQEYFRCNTHGPTPQSVEGCLTTLYESW